MTKLSKNAKCHNACKRVLGDVFSLKDKLFPVWNRSTQKLVFDDSKIWLPEQKTTNGFEIGEIVFYVDIKNKIISEFEIIEDEFNIEYIVKECKLFGKYREYIKSKKVISLKMRNGTKTSGLDYDANWFNMSIEFPFDLITKSTKELIKFRKEVPYMKFTDANLRWSSLNIA